MLGLFHFLYIEHKTIFIVLYIIFFFLRISGASPELYDKKTTLKQKVKCIIKALFAAFILALIFQIFAIGLTMKTTPHSWVQM